MLRLCSEIEVNVLLIMQRLHAGQSCTYDSHWALSLQPILAGLLSEKLCVLKLQPRAERWEAQKFRDFTADT